ncbi:MAG: GtrA family protein [Dysgonamonadaceae bacterium]|jgi:putative flippase GtrA|nr:GtrA family protein [Dysgonamonadaceae bacterium]
MKGKNSFVQLIKYGIVGVSNTLLTAFIIWVILKFLFGVNGDAEASPLAMSIANIFGFVAGVINSFVFNRKWTFNSSVSWKKSFLKFSAGFACCYLIQLGIVLLLNESDIITPIRYKAYTLTAAYICQLIGIVSYTLLNFFYNKYYAFKK